MSKTSVVTTQLDTKSHPDRRRTQIRLPRKIRYTDAEWATVVEHARACGRPPARYVRETSLRAAPRPRSSHTDAALIRELGRAGTVLTRLTATARETGATAQALSLDAVLSELLAVVRRLG